MKTEVYVERERQTDRERWEKGRERIGYHNCLMTSSLLLLMTSCSAIIKLYTFVTPGGLIIFSSCIKLLKKNIHACNIIFDEKKPIESSNAYFFKDCYYISPEMFYGKFGVELSPIFYTPFPYCVLSLFSLNVRWHQSDIQVRISSSVAQHCLVYKLCYV